MRRGNPLQEKKQQAQYMAKKKQQQYGWDESRMIGMSYWDDDEEEFAL